MTQININNFATQAYEVTHPASKDPRHPRNLRLKGPRLEIRNPTSAIVLSRIVRFHTIPVSNYPTDLTFTNVSSNRDLGTGIALCTGKRPTRLTGHSRSRENI